MKKIEIVVSGTGIDTGPVLAFLSLQLRKVNIIPILDASDEATAGIISQAADDHTVNVKLAAAGENGVQFTLVDEGSKPEQLDLNFGSEEDRL